MPQILIVEGKDAIVIAKILEKRNKQVIGYEGKDKFKNEFVKNAKGVRKIRKAIIGYLDKPEFTNIGIVVDADNTAPESRLQSIRDIVKDRLGIELTGEIKDDGYVFQNDDSPTIGVWVMPNNKEDGYLEHFVGNLIESDNKIWPLANKIVDDLMKTDYCPFVEVRAQKAKIYSFLALQKSPGLPMGQAIDAKYFDAMSSNADAFINWMESTFEIGNVE